VKSQRLPISSDYFCLLKPVTSHTEVSEPLSGSKIVRQALVEVSNELHRSGDLPAAGAFDRQPQPANKEAVIGAVTCTQHQVALLQTRIETHGRTPHR
jgi:hypothetical protein